ncbi:MAG: hypothetical protein ACFE8B_08020, partial [Candidatus Hermodarchaeota archaeon]
HQKRFGPIDPKIITLLGEDIDNINIFIDLCASKLEDIHLKNFKTNSGQVCSGCFMQAYHLLNILKTYMVKDLKYNPRNVFLVGLNPNEPERFDNVVLFGDCALRSTINSNFREIRISSKKNSANKKKTKKRREENLQKKEKVKVKTNKNILELPGCPPDIFDCLKLIIQYYGKKNLPNLTFSSKLLEIMVNPKDLEKLRVMGVI